MEYYIAMAEGVGPAKHHCCSCSIEPAIFSFNSMWIPSSDKVIIRSENPLESDGEVEGMSPKED